MTMRSIWRHPLALLGLAGSLALLGSVRAPANSSGELAREELAASRQLLERWRRNDPEHYARLKREYREFMALPEDRRQELRLLDDRLHDDDPSAQRFWTILDRYTVWIGQLSEKDRQRVAATRDLKEKLDLIRALRDQEWVSHLPRVLREQVQGQPEGEARNAFIVELRKKERLKQAEWARAIKLPEPIAPLRLPSKPAAVVPVGRLRQFVQHELTREEREAMGLATMNDLTRHEALLKEFEARYPEEVKKIRKARESKKKEPTK